MFLIFGNGGKFISLFFSFFFSFFFSYYYFLFFYSSQALGLSGYLFGWTKCLHSKVSTQANEKLIAYKNKKYGNTSETENVLNNNSSNDSNTV